MAARFLREDVNTGSNILLDWCVKYVLVDSKRDHLIGAL
ncbi:Uncharacterised protein [Candidatus Bartonella washoeensis]|uniref:Uncharacterized protein n=1 Tax=Candidatus Bartonella washoeensis Sb944nv TaxID=1094563 RepID=J1J3S9_9HYPH|nr:hypothetical protein MCQ_01156 [Bartonella washoeensis Sb944nv]SPU27965.1 Uncharacterised protein [Bartonella washoeensis]SPU27966.1 Uncharacterised protein [Bartonella washoeensis]